MYKGRLAGEAMKNVKAWSGKQLEVSIERKLGNLRSCGPCKFSNMVSDDGVIYNTWRNWVEE